MKSDGAVYDQYVSDVHCCRIGYEWTGIRCEEAEEQCYEPKRCAYKPPNDPSGVEEPWWTSNKCINTDTDFACCYYEPGLYGQDVGYWYKENIVIY